MEVWKLGFGTMPHGAQDFLPQMSNLRARAQRLIANVETGWQAYKPLVSSGAAPGRSQTSGFKVWPNGAPCLICEQVRLNLLQPWREAPFVAGAPAKRGSKILGLSRTAV